MKKIELLAPAGNMESLIAAIEAGCDAVYIGGKYFSARGLATNFDDAEIIEAINYSHLRGVKVYVAINIMIYEYEVDALIDYARFLHQNNVDAVIMQDLGMISLVRSKFPNLEIHASTQLHIHNSNGIKLMKEMGLKRVVIARETNIEIIKEMKNLGIELEVFVQGALCISYSGQCLMSSLIGGRSGNRGTCAGCCRKPYSLYSDGKKVNENEYLLSSKDLCAIDNIDELIESGVDSIKIEGRMKRSEYVYQVVKLYRDAIDNKYSEEDMFKLKKIFNRKFTKGFLLGETDITNDFRPNHMGVEVGSVVSYKNSQAYIKLSDNLNRLDGIRIIGAEDKGKIVDTMYIDNKLIETGVKGDLISIKIDSVNVGDLVVKTSDHDDLLEINKMIEAKKRKVLINADVKIDKDILVTLSDSVNSITVSSDKVYEALNAPISKEDVLKHVSKLGDTCYKIDNSNIEIIGNKFISVGVINGLKRDAVELLNDKRLYKIPFIENEYSIELNEIEEEFGFNAYFSDIDVYNSYKDYNFKNIYLDNLYDDIDVKNKILKLSNVMNEFKEYDVEVLAGELGSVYKYNNVVSDYSLNVANSYTVAFLHSIGVKRVCLSVELNDSNIIALTDAYIERYNKKPNLELVIYHYPVAMTCKFNLLNKYNIDSGILIDEYDNRFKVEGKDLMKIYHFDRQIRDKAEYYKELGINSLRVNIDSKDDKIVNSILNINNDTNN